MFAIRDTKAKYRNSLLGIFWAFVPPLVAAISLTAARNSGVLNLGHTSIPYPAFVILSVSLWQNFTSAVTQPITGLVAARFLMTKVDFPREVILLSEGTKLLTTTFFQAILVTVVFAYYRIPIESTAPWICVSLCITILLGLSVSVLLAPLALLYGDISSAMPLGLGALFLVTPVVYVSPPAAGVFAFVVNLNPLTPLIGLSREFVYSQTLDHLPGFLLVSALTLPLACVALVLFRISMPVVVERWSS